MWCLFNTKKVSFWGNDVFVEGEALFFLLWDTVYPHHHHMRQLDSKILMGIDMKDTVN